MLRAKRAVRSDRKFLIKVWVPISKKRIFRGHCLEHHMSMMFVGEQYLIKSLTEFDDFKLREIIDNKIKTFNNIKGKNMETLGIRVTNDYWQKLAFFAVSYNTSIAKIASCLFDYCLSAYEMREVWQIFGLTFKKKKKRRSLKKLNERLSDW